MNCKNCKRALSLEDKYCNECGAKVINHRLTLKHFFSETVENMFSIDTNKPLRTVVDLILKPAKVIGGYIDGVRKKYLNPFAFFTLAITLSGLYYYLINNVFSELLEGTMNFGKVQTEGEKEMTKNMFDTIFEYQTFIFFLSIPLLALISRLVFLKNKKYNYTEHLIINLYAYSLTSIIMVLFYLATLWNVNLYIAANLFGMLFLFSYYLYALQQLYQLNVSQTILKFVLFGFIFLLILIIVNVILIAGGAYDDLFEQINKQAELQKSTSYIASSVINWTS
ncbi:hypothetical protein ULMA_17520 [Patiriisocius marinus]|uniref:DUF3667 domain-containing protein n=1 Tax=Patiriisocius marinus TaxID=1397112 RepID=A0A5J4IXF5_9FLAO|nr:DUF3667 domain-containing protein [Patiriisocius marinus]GER59644.1 hypothetical protein ULMA_17520 [Patiriisocius marinus]